ncbi:MAG: transporter family protein [Cypionkella sp.]|nr:transporter family protein [Cypionkella sp.]
MGELRLENVSKSFGSMSVIKDVSLTIETGEFVVLVGPSGCGKSTLLRCIAGLEPITGGKLTVDGVDITDAAPVERGLAMVFQSYALYPHMTAAENIGFGLRIAKAPKAEIAARVSEIASLLQIEHLLPRKPKTLSGGQRQRVAIGRALARKPKFFLFDEPLSNLDAALRAEMRVELARLHAQLGNTMIYVTHDQVEGMTLANRIVVMNAGQIEQCGSPLELFNRPRNKFVAGFLGQPPINFVRVTGWTQEGGDVQLALSGGTAKVQSHHPIAADAQLELGIRPEDLRLADKGLPVTVEVVEHLGNETIVHSRLGDGCGLTVRLTGQAKVQVGDLCHVALDPERAILFDTQGNNVSGLLA